MDSDRVMVLDKGIIAEFDSPDKLIARPDSIFRGMALAAGIIDTRGNRKAGGAKANAVAKGKADAAAAVVAAATAAAAAANHTDV